ncbi:thioredoxin-like protein AAED1, chloroplastic [Gossypium australe]|uniref:Thioredoxin-like protein AAED1, chloroplastic n=1 Tax=Gossypium australe TaxID=47621 RepID=A0A5B6WEU1_9ROSI|nr:thioredoxin-like protein AAED1, chloroplastic [Gossypium australe]
MAMMTCSRIFLCFSTPRSQFPTVISYPSHFLTPKKATYKSTKHITLNANGGNSRFMARVSSSSAAEFPTNIGNMLSDVTIFTASGQPVLFKDLWDQNEGVAVVAFLRHFGCFCCWELASALKEAKPKFDSAGVKLIAVGVGTPDRARILAERVLIFPKPSIFGYRCEVPFPMDSLYADPERKDNTLIPVSGYVSEITSLQFQAYDVLGLYYGLGRTFFNPASAKVFSRLDKVKKAMENYTIKATPDDTSSVLQQGGMFVFKGKQLLYARKDEGTGDHAPLDDIFDVCCKTPVA